MRLNDDIFPGVRSAIEQKGGKNTRHIFESDETDGHLAPVANCVASPRPCHRCPHRRGWNFTAGEESACDRPDTLARLLAWSGVRTAWMGFVIRVVAPHQQTVALGIGQQSGEEGAPVFLLKGQRLAVVPLLPDRMCPPKTTLADLSIHDPTGFRAEIPVQRTPPVFQISAFFLDPRKNPLSLGDNRRRLDLGSRGRLTRPTGACP